MNDQPPMSGGVALVTFGIIAAIATVLVLVFKKSPEENAKEVAAVEARYAELSKDIDQKKARQKIIEEGYKSRDEFDAATRDNTADRRKRLEAASASRTMSNKHGVRIDRYRLKDGRTVVCTTTVPAAGPAVFDCDGEP